VRTIGTARYIKKNMFACGSSPIGQTATSNVTIKTDTLNNLPNQLPLSKSGAER